MTTSAKFLTRFAPSPSGFLHLGNARTALFNWLAARTNGGEMLLRIEDTDAKRSDDAHIAAIADDLNWLGLEWRGDNGKPHRQSANTVLYQQQLDALIAQDAAYPCFCPPAQLQAERARQIKAGKPPRYSGKCAALSTAAANAKINAGESAAIRLRMPPGQIIINDKVRGEVRFVGEDIGDFILRRANGAFSFFFANAIDDSAAHISLVLRGEDHLSNTPRQIAILTALKLSPPDYGHLPLMRAANGELLSKRDGALAVRDLRRQGFLPHALNNYLARVGCALQNDNLLSLAELAAEFSLTRINNSPAAFDAAQLNWRQKESALALSATQRSAWLSPILRQWQIQDKAAFCAAIGENIALFADAEEWAKIIMESNLKLTSAAQKVTKEAGADFYKTAASMLAEDMEWKDFCRRVSAATDMKGRELFLPLRTALTGRIDGPTMAGVFKLIGMDNAKKRLNMVTTACII